MIADRRRFISLALVIAILGIAPGVAAQSAGSEKALRVVSEALKTIPATDLQNFGGNPVPPPARIGVSGSRILLGLKWMR
jgi:hypothetical protein